MTARREPSRRDFLATSAVALAGLAGRGLPNAAEEGNLENLLLYVGTYTQGDDPEGIHLVRMESRTGRLGRVGAVKSGPNPSFLALHPGGRVLYAANEILEHGGRATGTVSAFAIANATGALSRISQQPSSGGAPCYVSVDRLGRALLVANYVGGNVALLPIDANGSLQPASDVRQHAGKGANPERQEAPHAHCIVPDPGNRFALAADLGIDRVLVYRLDLGAGSLTHVEGSDARLRPGSGPRHLAFHPTLPLVYVANELSSTVSTLPFDPDTGSLSVRDTRSTTARGWKGANYPADIHVAPDGRTLYVSNRGQNSIAVFSIAPDGALALEQTISTEGDWPRNFALDPTGGWLLVANQRSDSIVVFSRDPDSGRLTTAGHSLAIAAPVCLRFATPA